MCDLILRSFLRFSEWHVAYGMQNAGKLHLFRPSISVQAMLRRVGEVYALCRRGHSFTTTGSGA